MLAAIKSLVKRAAAQGERPAVSQPAYSLEQDGRVMSILGREGLEFSRRLERAKRVDPNKFYEAIDAIIQSTPDELQREYGLLHRRRFFELFNLSAELIADVERPLVLEFGVGEHTRLYKAILPGVRIHTVEYPDRYGTGGLNVDQSYELDLSLRTSRDAAPIQRASYDLVIFAEVLEHLMANPVEIIEWLLSLVKPGGYLLLTTPNMFAKQAMPVYLSYDNPLAPFPIEETRALGQAHLREYSHIELLRFVQAAGGVTKALIFSSCWDDDETLAPVERKNLILVATPPCSSPQCRRALDDVIRRLGIAEALSEHAIEAVALRLIDEIRFSSKLGARNRAPLQPR
ncbi:class I SAM-dependent methyltransferase [Methylocella sp.]|jgi:SAM-dependent methyltransferase|uniref:class I SAM-dependent methyltransferase n=1 Tax=Methylocella sp. TaxID=1978226 RepID=UPI003C23F115